MGAEPPISASLVPPRSRSHRSAIEIAAAIAVVFAVAMSASGCGRFDQRMADSGPSDGRSTAEETTPAYVPEYEMIDILPRDAIPAIDEPRFWDSDDARANYPDDMLVLGVAFDGEARAYSIPFLSRHEIVNDSVGGRAITVTW